MTHDALSLATLLCAGVLGLIVVRRYERRVRVMPVRIASRPRR